MARSFNSRTLGRVRLRFSLQIFVNRRFQFTHPGKGATVAKMTLTEIQRGFNSRTLGRVRRYTMTSIVVKTMFQFTHPGKGATRVMHIIPLTNNVSIHAPWEGCDSGVLALWMLSIVFQFTHPGKGATLLLHICAIQMYSFNSRTLGRVRHIDLIREDKARRFQFTHPGKGATPRYAEYKTANDVSIHAPWEGCDSEISI